MKIYDKRNPDVRNKRVENVIRKQNLRNKLKHDKNWGMIHGVYINDNGAIVEEKLVYNYFHKNRQTLKTIKDQSRKDFRNYKGDLPTKGSPHKKVTDVYYKYV